MTALGIRLNNPGDIRKSSTNWQGMADQQPDPNFVTFKTPQYGIRAMVRNLMNYQARYGLNTVRGIITRYAPPSENNTAAYIAAVCSGMGVGADDEIDVDRAAVMLPMVKAIIIHETGSNPYSDAVITEGMRMAGISDAPSPPLTSQPHVVAQAGAAGSLGIAGAVQYGSQLLQGSGGAAHTVKGWSDQLSDFSALPFAQEAIHALLTIAFGLTAISIAYTAYNHFRSA